MVAAGREDPDIEDPGNYVGTVAERVILGGREDLRHCGAGQTYAPEERPGGARRRRAIPYRFEHYPESGAYYIQRRIPWDPPSGEPGFGPGVDVVEGNVLGFEFLSFEEYVKAIDHSFVLEVPEQLETTSWRGTRSTRRDHGQLMRPHRKVSQLFAEGLTTQEVASRLSVSRPP